MQPSVRQRVCAGVGGRGCGRRMSSMHKDPHLQCPTCRGKYCDRNDTCAVCTTWDEVQWTLFESRRTYKKKGQFVPVLGGGVRL